MYFAEAALNTDQTSKPEPYPSRMIQARGPYRAIGVHPMLLQLLAPPASGGIGFVFALVFDFAFVTFAFACAFAFAVALPRSKASSDARLMRLVVCYGVHALQRKMPTDLSHNGYGLELKWLRT